MFATGFTMNSAAQAEDMHGPSVDWMREEAAALSCVITGSLVIRDGDRHYNRLLWVRPDGEIAHYDKRHLFRMIGEHENYSAGGRRLDCTLKGWRIRPFICYDLRFPVWSRSPGDCDLLIYVANWPSRRHQAWSTLLRARAIENQCYVVGSTGPVATVTARRTWRQRGHRFSRRSSVGEGNGDGVETAVLDMESLQAFRAGFPGASRCRRVRAGLNPAIGRRAVPGADSDEEAHARHPSPRCRGSVGQRALVRPSTSRSSSPSTTSPRPSGTIRAAARALLSRVSNPTLRQLENALAEMQGRDELPAYRVGDGRNLGHPDRALKQGDHVVYFAEMYQPTRSLIRRVLGRFGVTSSLLSIDDLAGLERCSGSGRCG